MRVICVPRYARVRDELADQPRGWSAARAAPGHAVRECLRDACTPRHRPDRVAERRSLVCDSLFGDVLQPIWCRSGASTGNCTFASALLGCTYELLRERCMFRKLSNVFMRVVLTVSSYLVDTWTRFFPSPGLFKQSFVKEISRGWRKSIFYLSSFSSVKSPSCAPLFGVHVYMYT